MADWSALQRPPVWEFTLSEDETVVTITYSGYFTDGSSIRFGRASGTQSALVAIGPTLLADIATEAYESVFPPEG